jgi:hypothetical protein
MKDALGADSLRVSKPRTAFNIDDIFGPDIQKSGSIVRGFTVGSNRDLSLNSGLRMQLAGKIASDVEVIASLTDESTPIQPEGTTQTLQEFDKVFVEIRSTDVTATLGDFNLDLPSTEFARISRKLQGAKGTGDYRLGLANGSVTISGAVTRGKYNTNQFQGLEGVQGPYRLTGRNNESLIIIIAGTEKVFVNGEVQTRGETNDYTIDYSTGELTFTARRLITSASRIVVDFEYTDRQYARSLFAAQSSSNIFENKATLRFSYLREADDQDAPIDIALTDSAKRVLENAGDNRDKAVLSGITQVDSNGTYIRVDTTIDGAARQFYRYSPGNRNARYNVTFSNVGPGRGEYVRQQIGVFVWRGPGAGDYLPLNYLPLPQLHQVMDVALDASPVQDLKVTGEFGRSIFDANRFSKLDDGDNGGHAIKFMAAYAPRDVHIGGKNIGAFDILLNERFIDRRFVTIDRTNDIEFNRKWGIDTVASGNEEIQEASLKYSPSVHLSIGGGYGKIARGDQLRSTRNDGTFALKGEGLPTANYFIESIRTRDYGLDDKSSWIRQKGSIEDRLWKFTPVFRYERENREITSLSTSSLKPGSLRFDLFAPGFKLTELGKVSLSADFEWRTDNLYNRGIVTRESRSFTESYAARLSDWNTLTSSLDVTLREKRFSQTFQQLGNSDIKTVLVRSQNRIAPFNHGIDADLFYEAVTERSSRLERVFVRVTQGTGNYKYLGDLNNNGIADENEFELSRFDGDFIAVTLPTDQLYPVIDLKTSARFRLTPRLFIEQSSGLVGSVASALSTETYVRVEEKSTEQDLKQIYLLHFSKFRQDSTTITGSTLFSQDIFLFENQPGFSTRFRFSQRKGLNKLSGGIERSFARERSIRMRWQFVNEISNQVDYVNRIDRVNSAEASSRLRDILSNSLVFDLSYRPEQNVEVGFKFEVGKSTDRYQTPSIDADLNAQTIRCVFAIQGAGQARVEASREEILLGRAAVSFPYELTGGRTAGKTWLWRVAFDYRVTQFIQATLNYDGRAEGGRSALHTARAEVRAFF